MANAALLNAATRSILQEAVRDFEIPLQNPPTQSLVTVDNRWFRIRGSSASQFIPRGTCIVSSRRLLSVQKRLRRNNVFEFDPHDIDTAVNNLNAADLQSYNSLAYTSTGHNNALGRFLTNHIEMQEDSSTQDPQTEYGIFVEASFFNHSCVPNAFALYNESLDRVTVFALENIQRGTPIFYNYLSEQSLTFREREHQLSRYNFACHCDACCDANPNGTDFPYGAKSNPRRMDMKQVSRRLQSLSSLSIEDKVENEFGELHRKLLNVMEEEGIFFPEYAAYALRFAEFLLLKTRSRILQAQSSVASQRLLRCEALKWAQTGLGWTLLSCGDQAQSVWPATYLVMLIKDDIRRFGEITYIVKRISIFGLGVALKRRFGGL